MVDYLWEMTSKKSCMRTMDSSSICSSCIRNMGKTAPEPISLKFGMMIDNSIPHFAMSVNDPDLHSWSQGYEKART